MADKHILRQIQVRIMDSTDHEDDGHGNKHAGNTDGRVFNKPCCYRYGRQSHQHRQDKASDTSLTVESVGITPDNDKYCSEYRYLEKSFKDQRKDADKDKPYRFLQQ